MSCSRMSRTNERTTLVDSAATFERKGNHRFPSKREKVWKEGRKGVFICLRVCRFGEFFPGLSHQKKRSARRLIIDCVSIDGTIKNR